jgi:hypothetical protein
MQQEFIDGLEKLFVVTYSMSQDSMMVETLLASVKKNRAAIKAGRATDYVPVVITDDRKKADMIANQVRQLVGTSKAMGLPRLQAIADIIRELDPLSSALSLSQTGT